MIRFLRSARSAPCRRAAAFGLAALLALVAAQRPAGAQSLAPAAQQQAPRSGQQAGPTVSAPPPAQRNAPFGASMFTNQGFPVAQSGPNPAYQLLVGDQVRLNLYGAIQQDTTETIDPQGNIFIPQVGPVKVAGVQAGNLTTYLSQKIQETFKGGEVRTYATLVNARNIGVFVTGFVTNPGRYPGLPSDSIIDYLARAGGIVNGSGSYRNVTVKRADRVVHSADLYEFLLDGKLPRPVFLEGDTIVVGAQDSVVKTDGQARNLAIFEFKRGRMTGQDLIRLSRPLPGVTHVSLVGVRERTGYTKYLPITEFAKLELSDQDMITFTSDIYAGFLSVSLSGLFQGPSTFVVDRTTSLFQLLDYVPVDEGIAATESVSLKRRSVAEQQKAALNSALDALERSILTADVRTSGEAQIRSAEATMVMQFIQRARTLTPDGTLVLTGKDGRIRDLRLEEGDVVVVPQRSSTITIAGEVLTPQTYVYDPAFTAADYVARAGGYTDRADEDRFMVRHLNGSVELVKTPQLVAGDELIILPKISFKGFQFAQDLADIIFKTLGTAALAIRAVDNN